MDLNEGIWLAAFVIGTCISFFLIENDKKKDTLKNVFSSTINWIFLAAVIGIVVFAFFSKSDTFKKGVALGCIALTTAFFVEMGMMFAPFFLTLCLVMAFPALFK
jgi:peptidoglycan/LPS O-acetylase OafA/YrhL